MACVRIEHSPAAVATFTLARPDKLNALNAELLDELRAAVDDVGRSDARCLLITGEGRGFSSGADLGASISDDLGAEIERRYNPLIEALAALPIPIVAAVNGVCAGAGCSLALAADIVIAARSAYFVFAFVNIGLIPDAGATWLLPRLIGRARALELMLLGEPVYAEEAQQWGLIARMVEDEFLAEEAMAMAVRLAQGPTKALGLVRKLARNADRLSLGEALQAERDAQREAGRSEDFRAAVAAFLEKRQPQFRGR